MKKFFELEMTPSFDQKKNSKTFIFYIINNKNAEGFIHLFIDIKTKIKEYYVEIVIRQIIFSLKYYLK